MKTQKESIQMWTGDNAPKRYRRFFPFASEFDWIAVVAPTAVREFGNHLLTTGPRVGTNVFSQPLADGAWMFYGQVTSVTEREE